MKEIKNVINFFELQLDSDFPVDLREYEQQLSDSDIYHFHNAVELGLCLKGAGIFHVEDRDYLFEAGDVAFVRKGEPHVAQSPDEQPSQWVYLGVDVEKLFSSVDISMTPQLGELFYYNSCMPSVIRQKDITDILTMIVEEMREKKQDYQSVVKSLLWVLFLKIARLEGDKKGKTVKENSAKQYRLIAPALNHICHNYAEEITIDALSSLCFLSPTHFRRVFREVMNLTPYDYLSQIRIRMAAVMLKSTDIPVMQVVFATGHNSATSFDRNFKKLYRMTPSEYRRQAQSQKDVFSQK